MRAILLTIVVSIMTWQIVGCTKKGTEFSLSADSKEARVGPVFQNKIDILFIIDNSSSMSRHQADLADSSSLLLSKLKERGLDYRIAATTTDMSGDGERGRFIGKPSVLNSTTPGLEDALRKKIFAGVDGSTVEQGLAAMKEALSPAKLADENQGFFRNDALLAIIVLSNEDDSSVGKVEDYTKFLDELKEPIGPDDRGWILNYLGVLGTPLENCKTFGQYVDPGYRYIDVSDYSKGSSSTICTTSLKQAVNNLEKIILELVTQIVLERIPRKETIEVFMDGLRVEEDPVNGWTYNEQGNSVQFHGSSIPHSDTDIRIIFQPMTAK